GMGGHCIPVDPFYLTWKARKAGFSTQFINLAGRLNTRMPHYVVHRVHEALGRKKLRGARVLVLGLSYKKDIDDPRESPSFKIIELLKEAGAVVTYHDPYFPSFPAMRHYRHLKVESVPLTDETLSDADVVVLATDHSSFDTARIAERARRIVDTRNAFAGVDAKWRGKIVKA
ncbi:MAG: nucleotide sugar dehydrogenase, partial [Planctomycetes bacterium]|nr:nucleotide sugar dehydrogenase [Planctomycetota bacterium]